MASCPLFGGGAMVALFRDMARRVLPGRMTAAARILFGRVPVSYSTRYPSFAAAARDATGYADPAIFEATRAAARAVKRGEAAYERGGIAHRKPNHAWAVLACLQHVALRRRLTRDQPMHLVDFGGSLGTLYFQNRRFVDAIPLLWSVVEQPHYAACGNAEFADGPLAFFTTIAEAAGRAPVDAVLFSACLEYLDAPDDTLVQAAARAPAFIIIAGSHLGDQAEDEYKVQTIKPPLHPARLAMRVLSKAKLVAHMERIGYAPVAAFHQGYLFQRRTDVTAQTPQSSLNP